MLRRREETGFVNRWSGVQISHPAPPRNMLDPPYPDAKLFPVAAIALAILAAVFYFALQIPWVAALFG
jgi:hypothetical protein